MDLSAAVLRDFAVIMTIGAAVTIIFHWLKQPLVLGYLMAGVIIGPYTPPFSLVSRLDVLGAAANLGMILLLFGIGLQFPMSKLRSVGFKVSAGVAGIEIGVMFIISFILAWILQWRFLDALFLGAALASTSTAIIAKVLSDMGKLNDTSALLMLGVAVAEDLVVVILLSIITSLATASPGAVEFVTIAWTAVKIVLFLAGVVLIGGLVVPRLVDKTTEVNPAEVTILAVLGLAFGLSIIADELGFTMAIGAFLTGVLVASSKSAAKVASLTSPIKDMFAAMFFVSIGALIDFSQVPAYLLLALIVTVVMVLGKVLGCGLGTRLFGYDTHTALRVGLGMGQIGEFAFIVMKVGQDLGVISPFLFPTVAVAAAITTFLTPYMINLSYKITTAPISE